MNSDPDNQIPFLSFGFRPFFLFAGVYGVLAMAAWLAWLGLHAAGAAVPEPTIAAAPHMWHGHEMLYGYAAAVISGFMLTAVPNWTGARRVAGTPLLALALIWLAGRIAMWFSAFLPAGLVAAADLAHLPVLGVMVAAGLFVRPAPRNLIFLGLIAVLIVGNGAVHAEWLGLAGDTASWGLTVALLTYSLMIAVIGGRVVPSFTRNALVQRGRREPLPTSFALLDRASIAGAALVLACAMLRLPDLLTGLAALAAGIANLVRLSLWRWRDCLASPILWSLHLGYLFLPVGYIALAGALVAGIVGETAALHLLAIGAVGGMTLAVMTRAALGHTGRPLVAGRATAIAYGLIALAAVVRGFGTGVVPSDYFAAVLTAGGLWVAGFGLFVLTYAPILIGPSRKDLQSI